MKNPKLIKGNIAIAKAAIKAGCRAYFGYPITPQNDIVEYFSDHMPDDGIYLQPESELSAINMIFGAAATGVRTMTSSSGPGISLMQEGISAIASAELPAVIVNVMRNGSGGGSIYPAQGDYFTAVKGGGNGDYKTIVLAPNSVQEMYDLTIKGFDLADKYRNPVMILADGAIGQLTEKLCEKEFEITNYPKDYCVRGKGSKEARNVITWHWSNEESEKFLIKLRNKYRQIEETETIYEEKYIEDADLVCISFGITSRIMKQAIENVRKEGIKAGYIRPITLFPFPTKTIKDLAVNKKILVLELNNGQMLYDVQNACGGKEKDIHFYGRGGGNLFTSAEIVEQIKQVITSEK